jgi:AP2-like factor, ANT lineage
MNLKLTRDSYLLKMENDSSPPPDASSVRPDWFCTPSGTQEEVAEAYDIAAIKFRGLNTVTNFDTNRYDVESILSSDLPVGGGATGRAAKFPLDSLQPGSASAMMLAGAAAASQTTMPPSEKDYWSLLALHYQQQQERQFPASAYEAYGSGGVNVDFTMGTSSGSYLKSGGRPRKKLSLRDGVGALTS